MNNLTVLVFATIIAAAIAQEKYTIKYDNIDLDSLLRNDRLLNGYIKCLAGKASCTPDGAELKRVLPDALTTGCSKCSEIQKKGSRKVLIHLIENKEVQYKELENIYDPTGQYKRKYCDEAKRDGVKISKC